MNLTSFLNDLLGFWSEWVRPSAGLPTVLWSLLLAVAAASGHLVQRYLGLPKVILLDSRGRVAHEEYVEITSVSQLEGLVDAHLGTS